MNITEMSMIASMLALVSALNGCTPEITMDGSGFRTTNVDIVSVSSDKTVYALSESVGISAMLENASEYDLNIESVNVVVKNLSDSEMPVVGTSSFPYEASFASGEQHPLELDDVFTVPAEALPGTVYSLDLEFVLEEGISTYRRGTFIRVEPDKETLLTYSVDKTDYNGLDIFTFRGGMSAEYGVTQSLASLSGGLSGTWKQGNGGGPEPVYATADFLERSLDYTVEKYEEVLGSENAPVETVVIGTGAPSVSYLSTSMDAVYLPIHFLVSANTEYEIDALLRNAGYDGYSAYATFGYDASMTGVGVAWIKLLEMPEQYKDFIRRHSVKNVIVYGVGENAFGETYGRKVIHDSARKDFSHGTIYMQYTGGGTEGDISAITERIHDYKSLKLSDMIHIADWESGVTDAQINAFASAAKELGCSAYSLTAPDDMIWIYNIASEFQLCMLAENSGSIPAEGLAGVCFNEYLVSHPLYELYCGYAPLLYWQFTDPAATAGRCFNELNTVVYRYFPMTDLTKVRYFLNSNYNRDNIREALVSTYGVPGTSVSVRDQSDADIWNPDNGMSAPVEKMAEDIVSRIGIETWDTAMSMIKYITIDDLRTLCGYYGSSISFVEH